MATPNRISVDDRLGDGPLLAHVPGVLADRLRPLALRRQPSREKRLMRVARHLFPALQKMEEMAVGESHRVLMDKSFEECCRDSKCIERALTLFEVAWQTGLTELHSGKGKSLAWGNTRMPLGACGLSVGQSVQFFLKMAVKVIFARNQKAYIRLQPFVGEKSSLPRMRLLAAIDALSLAELQIGWNRRFEELLTTKDDEYAIAVRNLKPYQVRSMRQVMAGEFTKVLDWSADMVRAVGEAFQCVDQFRDLGDFFILLTTPEAVRAVGRWERRDVTDRVNERRKQKGKAPLKGRRWETDIGLIKRILGTQFGTLLEREAALIDLFGEIFASRIRTLQEPQKGQAVEHFQLLAKRYLAFLTSDVLTALMEPEGPGGETFTFAEMIGILEGLWMKNGLGTAFFQGAFQTREGAEAVRGIAREYIDMKRRGSAKVGTDIGALIRDSDLFDKHLVPLMRKRPKAAEAAS